MKHRSHLAQTAWLGLAFGFLMLGVLACSGGGGGGSSATEESVPLPVSSASDIVITPPALSPQVSSQAVSENTPQSSVTSTPTTSSTSTTPSVPDSEVALTDIEFVEWSGSARKIGLRVTPVPAEAGVPGLLRFSWDLGSSAGRISRIDAIGSDTFYLFRCAEGFYGDVGITMSNSDDTIVKTVTVTCE